MGDKRILITGGAGFIGRAVVELCLAEGFCVAVYDNLSFGRQSNLTPFRKDIVFFENDTRDDQALDQALGSFKPECLVHLAAMHFIPYCNDHPQETLDVNVGGTFAVLRACVRWGVESIVFASTGALYASETHPLNEIHDQPVPSDVYGLSKLLGEQICAFFASTTDLQCRVARLCNTYGPYETNPHLIPHIIESLRAGPSVELGNVDTKRDYIYVEDVAKILMRYSQIDDLKHFTMNVGTGTEYSAQEIVECLAGLIGKPIEIVTSPDRVRKVDKLHQIADITTLVNLVGYLPQHTLQDGLKKLLVHEGLL
jgi:UDP-glucose 4-epimerase